jgi:transcriptional regulator with XRE-family HTH domain
VTVANGHVDLLKLPVEKRVKELRRVLGWTQAELAEQVGVNVRQTKRWEAGDLPSEENAVELARVAPRKLRAKPEWFYEPREAREERLLSLERQVADMQKRLKRAGL